MSQYAYRVLVYGGRGALGATCISHFKANNWWVGSVDFHENTEADANIILGKSDESLVNQKERVLNAVKTALNEHKLDAVFCVAGGWIGGNAANDLIEAADLSFRQSVWTSLISTTIAVGHLREGGCLVLTGAKAALSATPGMIGYGMAKASVHHLTKSLAGKNSGLPKDSSVLAILPVTLDTKMNRTMMPKSDFSSWTPLEFVAELFLKWTKGERPPSGSLVKLVTKNSVTELQVD